MAGQDQPHVVGSARLAKGPRQRGRQRLGQPVALLRSVGLSRAVSSAVSAAILLASMSAAPAAAWSRHGTEAEDEAAVRVRRPSAAPTAASSADGAWLSGTGQWIGSTACSAASAMVNTATAPVAAVGSYISSGSTALGQFSWEVAYMFGVNRTPVSQVHVADAAMPAASAQDPSAREAGQTAPAASPSVLNAAFPAGTVAPPPSQPLPSEPVPEAVLPKPPAATSEPATPPVAAVADVVPTAPQPRATDAKLLASLAVDKPQRRPDGSYFVPKPLQRMFDIRTHRADSVRTPLTVKLPGRIVPDPNAHGDVEASLLGRIEPPKTGMPVLGETVRKGQILGYVAPAIGVVDRSQVRREVARLTNEIRITAESVEILKQFWFVPFRDGKVMQAEVRLEGLRREREALLPMLQTQEVLRAAIDGVISASTAINGRIVHPGEKIFEIVNPQRLWIEAVAADPEVARGTQLVRNASAVTPEGDALDLTFIGSGLALQQQSVPLMFRIENPMEGLRVGRPVTVTIRNESKMRDGIPIAREAVVNDSGGAEQVWELVEPEVFMPHTVKTEMIDGRSVLISAGLEPGARIVTHGARLLSQFQ
ncbi:HlyD family efflux transporter periplasmic adaptor subunit [Azospirillum sp. TSH64]|uniref:efflux RND transporter periplasmic adaptor subunit n=1 Tax=Azospirillum sp. TSH64 TaxID=652740 RepID=UPI001FFE3F6B|nr:HlyD family efflux transporter periplasmic adaptor subunit [Azospirillum sp. TSH64]